MVVPQRHCILVTNVTLVALVVVGGVTGGCCSGVVLWSGGMGHGCYWCCSGSDVD
ncbi:Hypothetical predicted protein, partial [Olea europaea subsp. europaea]